MDRNRFVEHYGSEDTINAQIDRAISIMNYYDEDDYSTFEVFDECEHHIGIHKYDYSKLKEKDWNFINETWRTVLYMRFIEMYMTNQSNQNRINDLEIEIEEKDIDLELLEKKKNEELKAKDNEIEFLKDLNHAYRDEIDEYRRSL